MAQTKVVYYVGDENTPYLVKVPVPQEEITLGDFKRYINIKQNYKFFFQSFDEDFGLVKEEITNDNNILPKTQEGKIVCFLTPGEEPKAKPPPPERVDSIKSNREFVPPPPPRSTGSGSSGSKSRENLRHGSTNHRHHSNHLHNRFGSESTIMSSEISDHRTEYDDNFDDNSSIAYSTVTDMSSVSRQRRRPKQKQYRKKRIPTRIDSDSTSNYSSSVTDSTMSLNVQQITLDLEKHKFLGISIVGQNNESGDGGIYIGSIMKGGAVAADGRIEAGDMLLQVNDVNFEDMCNSEAVDFLRKVVQEPGPLTLTIAKCWDPSPPPMNHHYPPHETNGTGPGRFNEPIRPIDPAQWVMQQQNHYDHPAYGSMSQLTETSSDTFRSSLPESDRNFFNQGCQLTIHSEMSTVCRMMRMEGSGLDIRDRQWLKITIPNAFIGSELVDWLLAKVEGLADRRLARKYASDMLKANYVRHTVPKTTFSEQCYYVFGDQKNLPILPREMTNLSLTDSNSDTDTCRSLNMLPRAKPPTPNYPYGQRDFDAMSMCSSTSGMSSVSQLSVRDQIVQRVGQAQRIKQQIEDDRLSVHSSSAASTVSRVRSAII